MGRPVHNHQISHNSKNRHCYTISHIKKAANNCSTHTSTPTSLKKMIIQAVCMLLKFISFWHIKAAFATSLQSSKVTEVSVPEARWPKQQNQHKQTNRQTDRQTNQVLHPLPTRAGVMTTTLWHPCMTSVKV